jgi:ATP-dependent DNA helicase RecQ
MHTGAPKSLEHYQQETGRAGRDGLESECVLLYGGNDFVIWRKMNGELTGDAGRQAERNLELIERYSTSVVCRHRALVEHFGQAYERDNCEACDVCLDQQETIADALIVAQKILSCVVRVNENFGADYVAQVLTGSREQRILGNGHDQLSTYGLLKEHDKRTVREWIEQLCGQDLVLREGEYRILKVSPAGRQVLRGETTPRLLKPVDQKRAAKPRASKNFTAGMDAGLFEALRKLRRELADERGVPPFVVFGDVTLQDLARRRPTSPEGFRQVHGVGDQKAKQYSAAFLHEIASYCREHSVPTDVEIAGDPMTIQPLDALSSVSKSGSKVAAEALFREGKSIDEVMQQTGRARSTVGEYLAAFLEEEGQLSPEPWVDSERFDAVADAAKIVGLDRLKPIFEHFNGAVPYDEIRICLTCLRNRTEAGMAGQAT